MDARRFGPSEDGPTPFRDSLSTFHDLHGLAADYHILANLGFQTIHLVFDTDYSVKLRRTYFVFTANCATAALPGNIKFCFKKQKCFNNIL